MKYELRWVRLTESMTRTGNNKPVMEFSVPGRVVSIENRSATEVEVLLELDDQMGSC